METRNNSGRDRANAAEREREADWKKGEEEEYKLNLSSVERVDLYYIKVLISLQSC